MESVSLEEFKPLDIKAICQNSIIPLRKDASDASEMVSQLIFGELCTILEKNENWYRIQAEYDGYEGWVDFKHLIELETSQYEILQQNVSYTSEPQELLIQDNLPFPVTIGAELRNIQNNKIDLFSTQFELESIPESFTKDKALIPKIAYQFLNIPYLWGGKSTFGVDCSGMVQTVFKLIGVTLPRDAYQQAEEGDVLSFIEEAEAGDLVFFDNEEGKIIHVGILLPQNKIIHAHGKVRIDTLDYTGIYNAELNTHTHHLRFIRKIL